jgi:hypothetical protein
MKTFSPHTKILPESQRRLWPELAPLRERGFVLYGGTAVALQLGHRSSVDFDFFTEKNFEYLELIKILPWLADTNKYQESENTLTVEYKGVKISFFGGLDFGRVGEPKTTDDGILEVASLEDLLGLKLATILSRVNVKDYHDIAAMLKDGQSLGAGLATAQILYRESFTVDENLRALSYFDGRGMNELSEDEKNIILTAITSIHRKLPLVTLRSKTLSNSSNISSPI